MSPYETIGWGGVGEEPHARMHPGYIGEEADACMALREPKRTTVSHTCGMCVCVCVWVAGEADGCMPSVCCL